jgi:hypothetical protein
MASSGRTRHAVARSASFVPRALGGMVRQQRALALAAWCGAARPREGGPCGEGPSITADGLSKTPLSLSDVTLAPL